MAEIASRAAAIVGVGAVLPDAPDAAAYWANLTEGRYSISDVPTERWDADLYYDADPRTPDKTYSRIGGWVRDWDWAPLEWHLPVPPKVTESMDRAQQWAISATRQALADYGHPERPLDHDRTAVVLGNAMAGDRHYLTALRVYFPEYADELERAASFAALPSETREAVLAEWAAGVGDRFPEITEDSMPGELANIIAGRVANLFDFHGPNFVVDAACASAMAAIDAAIEGLEEGDYDAVVTGGVDANMSASSFVKFCKIGALSATGTRPYGQGADGFVMGEGAAVLVLKRLADAERDGDRIYAVVRGLGGASDGRGKGITAPNPVGQRLAIERAWADAGLVPGRASYIEGHGTSTKVGDVVEAQSLTEVFSSLDLPAGSLPLGSVKSNIGHLKGAAGAAGLLKAALALDAKVLPPSLGADQANPDIDFAASPLRVNTELTEWTAAPGEVRSAGVSAFGFGGTNFHVVLEEYVPGRLDAGGRSRRATLSTGASPPPVPAAPIGATAVKAPLRGALVVGGVDEAAVAEALRPLVAAAEAGTAPPPTPPAEADLRAPVRVAIDHGDAAELAAKGAKALQALESGSDAAWRMLANQGVHKGAGAPGRVAFLYTGQGSQYVNMLAELRRVEPIVARVFDAADEIMTPLLGRPLTDVVFADPDDVDALAAAEEQLRQTEITQPAVLTVDQAFTDLLAAYGIGPDLVMGHSLGEYGALVAAGALPFADALEAVSARGREMANVSVADNGRMAAVFAPLAEIERTLAGIDAYVVVANINSNQQAVIGGSSDGVALAVEALTGAGHQVVDLPVSHAFHTSIVEPAAGPLRDVLSRLALAPPSVPIVANVDGRLYPMGPGVVPEMIDILCRQIASPVQFVSGLSTLYDEGARVFVEVGPKRALAGFVDDVLGDVDDVVSLHVNHPKAGDLVAFNQALCGLYAAGLGVGAGRPVATVTAPTPTTPGAAPAPTRVADAVAADRPNAPAGVADDGYARLGRMFAEFLDRSYEAYAGLAPGSAGAAGGVPVGDEPVVVTGAGLGLPGTEQVFDDANVRLLLDGTSFIDVIPADQREAIVDKHITRLVKSDSGGGRWETIDSAHDVIKLAGRKGRLDLVEQFGLDEDRVAALDTTTELAIGAGLEALRDAGIPLVRRYKTTTTGSMLPDRWALPPALADDTGVIFASAFPGADRLVDEVARYERHRAREAHLAGLRHLRERLDDTDPAVTELDHMIHEAEADLAAHAYEFDRRFLFRVLAMGHSQFAEYIGARGPNTHVNAACASTTQALALAEDWIRLGRCNRVVVVSGDDVSSDTLLSWVGAGFLASGAAATDDVVADAALPFDRRRHGMLLGMGAAALVVERAAAARERGVRPICQVLGTTTANSAFHGSRLDVDHIRHVMEDLVAAAERRWGLDRRELAARTVFVSHETYTPARGGSAQAEVDALRHVFGDEAARIVIANTKGFTGHAMGVGVEDVLAVKALETGVVPPIANVSDPDPELGPLNLSKGGRYPIEYALRLGAGFGSQIAMSLCRWVPSPSGSRPEPDELGYEGRIDDREVWNRWLSAVSGDDSPEVEVDHRTLRIRDSGAPSRQVVVEVPDAETAPPVVAAVVEPEPAPAVVAEPEAEPAPAVVAEPGSGAAAEAGSVGDSVVAAVLGVVADQTGYPVEMLDLDLDLEADLGIDTVKQAETFAAIREVYGIERDDRLSLRDYPTLGHVVGFVRERADLADAGPAPDTTPAAAARGPAGSATLFVGDDEAAATVPRRIVTPELRPPLDWCVPTGVELGEGARVVVVADEGGVGDALAQRLERRGVDVLSVPTPPDGDELVARVDEWLDDGPVTGVYWLPALDPDPTDLDLSGWRAGLSRRVKAGFALLRHLHGAFDAPGRFLVAGTRLGGLHGYDDTGALGPMGGAVVGLAKAFKRERPEALVKIVDFEPSRKTAALADVLVDETLADPGAVEIGYRDERRFTIGTTEQPLPAEPSGLELGSDSVVVVTGAAGGIVSAIVADLARAAGGATFHLLDLAPAPDRSDPDLAAFVADREGLKRTIFERLKESGERATPALVERELARIERSQAAAAAAEAVEAAGGTAHHHQVDLRDADAVAAVMADVTGSIDRVDLVLHAAGLEISRLMPDKDPAEFDLVFDVKVDGWFNLLSGLAAVDLGAVVVFSSVAGRFGNAGQSDYSAANDLLCKAVSNLRATRPDTLGLAVDWTAWGDIGMATRGSIPTVMAAAGIDMLPARAGVPLVRRELLGEGTTRELVAGFALGVLGEPWHETGGLDVADDAPASAAVGAAGLVMLGRIDRWVPGEGVVVSTDLDPADQPFLDDHRIDGTPVLPGVMGIEAFAAVARALVADLHPDLEVVGIEDVDFLAPFKFYRDEPRRVTVSARVRPAGGDLVADCRLTGERLLAGADEPQVTVHFTGRVRLGAEGPGPEAVEVPAADGPAVEAGDVYRIYFHGPAYQVLERAWQAGGRVAGSRVPELPAGHRPEAATTVTEPRLVELCFQTAGVWEIGTTGAMALPSHVDRLTVRPGDRPETGAWTAVVVPDDATGTRAVVVDGDGRAWLELSGYRTIELPGGLDDDLVEPLRRAMTEPG